MIWNILSLGIRPPTHAQDSSSCPEAGPASLRPVQALPPRLRPILSLKPCTVRLPESPRKSGEGVTEMAEGRLPAKPRAYEACARRHARAHTTSSWALRAGASPRTLPAVPPPDLAGTALAHMPIQRPQRPRSPLTATHTPPFPASAGREQTSPLSSACALLRSPLASVPALRSR